MKLIKYKLTTIISAISLATGAMFLPMILNNVNPNIPNTQKTNSQTDLQVVNSVDEIVIEDINLTYSSGYAIVKNDGIQEVYAWGFNEQGQLGVGDTAQKTSPTKVLLPIFDTDTVIKSINIGFYASNALLEKNGVQQLYVWGRNTEGQLGLGDTTGRTSPTLLPLSVFGNGVLRKVKIGQLTSYAILDKINNATDIYVWGSNQFGQLGLGHAISKTSPILLPLSTTMNGWTLQQFEMGNTTDMFISPFAIYEKNNKQEVYTWGSNGLGQLGIGSTDNMHSPTKLKITNLGSDVNFIKFYISANSGYALIEQNGVNKIATWGSNSHGQLGIWDPASQPFFPTPVYVNSNFLNGKIVDAGFYGYASNTMYAIVDVNGKLTIFAWGYNEHGTIGNNSTTNVWVPYRIPTNRFNNGIIESYSFGPSNAMVIARVNNEQQVFVWGYNPHGELGLNHLSNILYPTRLYNPLFNESTITLPVTSRFGVANTIFSLQKDGKTSHHISGFNSYGQFGDGSNTSRLVHTQILPTAFTKPLTNEVDETKALKANISATDAMRIINADNVVSKTELAKYVDLTSFPTDALLSIDTDKTTINHERGIIDLVINSNKYYDPLIVPAITVPVTSLKEYRVSLIGFKPVKDININPVIAKVNLTNNINNVDNILAPLIDGNNEIKPFIDKNNTIINPDRMILEQYLDLSAIPLDATIQLNWTADKRNNSISIDFKSNHVYKNNGLTIKNENYITNLSFKISSLDFTLIAILAGTGLAVLVISLIACYKIRTNRRRSIISNLE